MRSNTNKERISGYIYQISDASGRDALAIRESGPNSQNPGTQYIAGTIEIAIDEECVNIIPVHFTYVTEKYSSGKTNRNFGVLQQIIEENKTCLTVGKENATKVSIDASISLNEWYDQNGNLVSTKRNDGSFINIVSELPDVSTRNTFTCDMIINSCIRQEAKEDGSTPAQMILGGCIFDFRNSMLPIDFIIRNEAGMNYFENQDISASNPFYTNISGKINCSSVTTTTTVESAFGEPEVTTRTKKTREWIVTRAAIEPFDLSDSEKVMSPEEFQKCKQDREIKLAELKQRSEEAKGAKNNASAFGTAPVAAVVEKKVAKPSVKIVNKDDFGF